MRALFVFATMLGLCVACGGKTESSSSASQSPSGGPSNDSPTSSSPLVGGLIAACPTTAPTNGASCANVGLSCEYGDDLNSDCNTIAHCNPDQSWDVETGSVGCPTSLAACPKDAATGVSCGANSICSAAQGFCTCFDMSDGPGSQTPPPPDYQWQCAAPDSACPAWPTRPRIGSACSNSDLTCDYDPCGQGGFAFHCDSAGYWMDGSPTMCGGA